MPVTESTTAKLKVTEIRGIYSRLMPLYGIWERLVESRARELALELAAVRGGETVLEVGVGPGTALQQLTRSNPGGTTIERTSASTCCGERTGAFLQPGKHRRLCASATSVPCLLPITASI